MEEFTETDLNDLRVAKSLLENPSFAAKVADVVGGQTEAALRYLPDQWREKVGRAVHLALRKGLEYTLHTMGDTEAQGSKDWLHKLMVTASGALGGGVGLAALPVELPISTCLMLRSIADIARSEGHDLSDLNVRLSCLTVLALGGRSDKDDAAKSGYWVLRAALAQAVSEATSSLAEKGLAEEGAPELVRLIVKIAARFGVVVSEEVAAKAVPVVGAAGGGLINYLFMDHFQDMGRGHFIIKRLERKYGTDAVEMKYHELDG